MGLEQRGIPTVTVVTSVFTSLAEEQARVLGVPDLSVVVVGHPVATLSADEVAAMADRAYDQIVSSLTAQAIVEVSAE